MACPPDTDQKLAYLFQVADRLLEECAEEGDGEELAACLTELDEAIRLEKGAVPKRWAKRTWSPCGCKVQVVDRPGSPGLRILKPCKVPAHREHFASQVRSTKKDKERRLPRVNGRGINAG